MWLRSGMFPRSRRRFSLVLGLAFAAVWLITSARATLPAWLQHAVSGTAVDAALFRAMDLPGVKVFYPRPPAESVAELNKLVASAPAEASLLSLRARQEESAEDFAGAERDWKAYDKSAPDHAAALSDLAEFYGRRHAVREQFATLLQVGAPPAASGDAIVPIPEQRSWKAFEQALIIAQDQSFDEGTTEPLWQSWLAHYPQQTTVYARAFTWELNHHRAAEARAVVDRCRTAFPADTVFPVKAAALLALQDGGPDAKLRALAVYDKGFAPLWPQELLNSYFDLLAATHNTRHFVADAQDRLKKDPEDLNAASRLFAYYRHESHPEAALAVLTTYSAAKARRDPSGRNWTADELYTVEELAASAQAYPDAARYAFALYHLPGNLADGRSARGAGLAAMVHLLLTAPEQPIALGAGNLSMYRDIATLDQGPGFWNGVLSLWLNDQGLRDQFAQRETKAQPYFHEAEAAVLLKLLDTEAPNEAQRAELHGKLIAMDAGYGEDAAVLHSGESFLKSFPHATNRVEVALTMADADARQKNTAAEFALYDRLLEELGRQTGNLPLAKAALASVGATPEADGGSAQPTEPGADVSAADASESASDQGTDTTGAPADQGGTLSAKPSAARAFELDTGPPKPEANPAATAYAQVLDRYLGRLTSLHQLPQALAVLRKELDRNPNEPRLYERMATFLSQNDLSAQEEEVFRAAIAKFDDKSWYDKLARFYLRQKRANDFATLTRKVTDIFSGSELEAYFAQVHDGGPQLALQLNLYAHKRFPHDLVFTQNLLTAYSSKPTADRVAWERLLRESWWQTPELTDQFFAFLSRTGKLQAELAALPAPDTGNPAALQERAEAALWASHFEASAPLWDRLAEQYPADETLGTTATDLNRSLAWLDPAGPATHIGQAVAIEERLLAADPGNTERLTRIGDILADHADGTTASYRASAVYWQKIPVTAPGQADTYLQAATVFWDYFQFDDALTEIHKAREHFADPALYGYEAGAILEGKRDLPAAVKEYTAAALAGPAATQAPQHADRRGGTKDTDAQVSLDPDTNPSADRLLQLARRAETSGAVDAASAAAYLRRSDLPTLQLRVAVLDAEHRGSEAEPLLLAAVHKAATADAAADLASYAQTRGDESAKEAALGREAELTPDPAERLALRYELVNALEARNDVGDAEKLVDATYHGDPHVLGVVRATVDFDWRNKRQKQAVDVLVEASQAAQPPLQQQFTAEAAAKANESGDPTRARTLATGLLAADPYNAQYLALVADSYAQAKDLPGLEQFYRARLEAVRSTPMTPEERRSRTALLRKGLIPALTGAKAYAAAVDEYIALVSAYPEDTALIREAALYADQYGQKDKLLGFYRQTVQTSPRDARFFVALAQSEAVSGDNEAAIDTYQHAVALRPERSDLFIAKAALEERLGRYAEAVGDYRRLYQLSYKDPQWMLAEAKVQARQGHGPDTVKALETAYLHGAQSTPHDRFLIAAQLEQWNMLPEARGYAEQGATVAGTDLLAGEAPRIEPEDAAAYARVLTRSRQTTEALRVLRAALASAAGNTSSSPATLRAQVQSRGVASVTDAEWRRSYVEARKQRAAIQFNAALNAMAETVAKYGTPEDHASFAAELKAQRGTVGRDEVVSRWIPAAHAAGLGALEASWRAEVLNSAGKQGQYQLTPYTQLQQARLSFRELGRTLEAFLRAHPRSGLRSQAVTGAVDAYGSADDSSAQLRLLQTLWASDQSGTPVQSSYMRLLAQKDPTALVSLAGSKQEPVANAAAEAALEQSSPELALRAIQARGASLGAVWTANYTALTGLYAGAHSPPVTGAFEGSLYLQATVAQRLTAAPDASRELTGKPWFYLAGRYGELLLASPAGQTAAEDVLAADLEDAQTEGTYLALARTEAEAGHNEAALVVTGHALELSPESAVAFDEQATLLWALGRKEAAITAWRNAVDALRTAEESGPAPESFWTGFARIAYRVHEHDLFAQLRPVMEGTLRSYLAHNGSYRSTELLKAAYSAAPSPAEGVSWVLSLAGAAKDPASVLSGIDTADWLAALQREAMLQREVELVRHSAPASGDTNGEPYALVQPRSRLLQLYLENRQGAQALALLQTMPSAVRKEAAAQEAEIIASAQTGDLSAALQHFAADPDAAPDAKAAEGAATKLEAQGDAAGAKAVLEWNFQRALAQHQAGAPEYLALAEARLKTGEVANAVSLLGAMTAASENPDTDRDNAAALLEQNGHAADAVPLLEALVRSLPWEASYRVRLAEARNGQGDAVPALTAVAAAPAVSYDLRARAARDLSKLHAPTVNLGSAELSLLASGQTAPAKARQPYFVQARVTAASASQDPKQAALLLQEAIAILPYHPDAQAWREQAFEANARAGQPTAAKAVLDSLFAQDNSYVSSPASDESESVGTDTAESSPPAYGTPLPHTLGAATASRKAAFALEAAAVYRAVGNAGLARSYLLYAAELAPKDLEAASARKQLADLEAQQRLVAANAARRPQITKDLDQPRIVRARLTTPPDVLPPGAEESDE